MSGIIPIWVAYYAKDIIKLDQAKVLESYNEKYHVYDHEFDHDKLKFINPFSSINCENDKYYSKIFSFENQKRINYKNKIAKKIHKIFNETF